MAINKCYNFLFSLNLEYLYIQKMEYIVGHTKIIIPIKFINKNILKSFWEIK